MWGLLKESIRLTMDAVQSQIDPLEVEKVLRGQPDFQDLHDLYIWAMSTRETALTVHLVKPRVDEEDDFLQDLRKLLHDRFEIVHSTI